MLTTHFIAQFRTTLASQRLAFQQLIEYLSLRVPNGEKRGRGLGIRLLSPDLLT